MDEDDFEFDEDGNRKAAKVVPVKAFVEEEEAPRTDIAGGHSGVQEEKKKELLGYDELDEGALEQASSMILAAKIKHKVLVRRSLKERLVFLSTKD